MNPLTFTLEGKQVTLYPREIADILDWASDLTQRLAEDSAPQWQDAIAEWESLIS